MNELTVRVPGCPARALSPNLARGTHWGTRRRAVAQARLDACRAARGAVGPDPPAWLRRVPLRLDAVIAWGHGRRRMDPTNLPAVLKAHVDGLADALGRNDAGFVWGEVTQTRAAKGDRAGSVTITVREAP